MTNPIENASPEIKAAFDYYMALSPEGKQEFIECLEYQHAMNEHEKQAAQLRELDRQKRKIKE